MNRDIPLLDLKTQYRAIKNMMEESVLKVMASGQYVLGPEVEAFEREFAFFLKAKHVVGVNSGTDALYLALKVCGIKPGDEVITTPHTFIAIPQAITMAGAKPVFIDVRESDANINPDLIRKKITRRTRAILPVHIYGFVCDMEKIRKVAQKHNLKIIEDCAQAAGAYWQNARTGVLSDAGCFSFYPTKNLSAYGDGGAVAVGDEKMAERLRALRTHGSTLRGYYEEFGINSRLDELQATVLRVKMLYLDRWNSLRRKLAANYDELLADMLGVRVFKPLPGTTPIYHLYPILVQNRDVLQERLAEKGITTMVHYPVPLHRSGALRHLRIREGSLPVAERISKEILSLPLYPELTFQEQEEVCEEIRIALRNV